MPANVPDHPSDAEPLAGKTAIVTGGTTGIGRATAIRLVRAGARVLIFGRNEASLAEAMDLLRRAAADGRNGGQAFGLTADLTDEQDIEQVFKEADDQLGGDLDIFVNNAGTAEDDWDEGTWGDWQQTVTTNLLATVACANAAMARMRPRKQGFFLIVGSMSADLREPEHAVYAATKAAVQAFGEALRKAVNPEGVRVCVLEPGAVDTPLQEKPQREKDRKVAKGEMLTADDIARAVEYILTQPARCDVVLMQIRPVKQAI